MQTSERTKFGKVMVSARNSIGQGDPFSESDLDLMFMALLDLTLDQVQQALIDHMNSKNGKWRPGTSYIRDMIQSRAGGQWMGGNEAWGRLTFPGEVKGFTRTNDWGDVVKRKDYGNVEPAPCLMNQQIAQALAVAQPEIDSGNMIAARVVFIETYERLVAVEKGAGRAPKYFVSGHGTIEEQEAMREEGQRLGFLPAPAASNALQLPPPSREGYARFKLEMSKLNLKALPPPGEEE